MIKDASLLDSVRGDRGVELVICDQYVDLSSWDVVVDETNESLQ